MVVVFLWLVEAIWVFKGLHLVQLGHVYQKVQPWIPFSVLITKDTNFVDKEKDVRKHNYMKVFILLSYCILLHL